MDIFFVIAGVFTGWMCLDCLQRKEHFVWVVIMLALFPIGSLIYFFVVKSKAPSQVPGSGGGIGRVLSPVPSSARELETEETLQLKELINQYHKAYHYDKLGQAYLGQKKFELAIPQFEEAIRKDPEMEEARYGLAKCLHGLGRFMESAEVLEKLVAIDRKYDYGNAIFGLADCYRLAGEDEKALQMYEEVINSFHFFKAYYHYARLLDKKGDKQGAIGYMKSIIGSSKDLPDYKLEKERYWIDEAYKFLKKNGIELA
ncbi:MAG: tetratricopeptide repeat protein [Candidatus Nitrohelix vancouverensis]|uniref:Tetratricopeptide repeat protein n=1 Tax=Candidatus Nitrohelix vancouverensis TaxID=2705534 RepID=A0A7T0G3X2_9BACT|nr:MAG: tetratricopeptide repeat protein [Candidatus Nitrohelix vancouverensis]